MDKEKIVLSDRISIPTIRSSSHDMHQGSASSYYQYLFGEDVRTMIIPYLWDRYNNPAYSIKILPDSLDSMRIIFHTFSSYQRSINQDVKSVVSSFIRDVIFHLVHRGSLLFEILEGEFVLDSKKIKVPVSIPGKVFPAGNYFFQVVPGVDRRKFRKICIGIPRSKVWKINIPSELGGNRQFSRFRNGLIKASDFLPKDLKDKEWIYEEDVFSWINHFDTIKIGLLGKATVAWGWNARNLWQDHALEYYCVYRELHFAKTLALLREFIVFEMNRFLKRGEIQTELTISGLPSSAEIDNLIENLNSGGVSFAQARDFITFR